MRVAADIRVGGDSKDTSHIAVPAPVDHRIVLAGFFLFDLSDVEIKVLSPELLNY